MFLVKQIFLYSFYQADIVLDPTDKKVRERHTRTHRDREREREHANANPLSSLIRATHEYTSH